MGPSGSGKTTLLDVLAGRKNAGKVRMMSICCLHIPTAQNWVSIEHTTNPLLEQKYAHIYMHSHVCGMQVEGDILFSGHKPNTAFLRRYTGYVEQFGERYKLMQSISHLLTSLDKG